MKLSDPAKTKPSYSRKRIWIDLSFLCILLALGYAFRDQLSLPHPFLTDLDKWKARPKLDPSAALDPNTRVLPCLFIVPPNAKDQPVASGSIGECPMLVPDGRKLDFFEVMLMFGGFFHIKTDLFVPDVIPLAFTRTHNPYDPWVTKNHPYLRHVYDPYLSGSRNPYTYLDWKLPDASVIPYRRIFPGTNYDDAVYENRTPFPLFSGSRIDWNGYGWDISLANGTTYLSPEAYFAKRPQQGSLVGIFDKEGREVKLRRASSGDLQEIKSPSGNWIRFEYRQEDISKAFDSAGNFTEYTYDRSRSLQRATYSNGQAINYAYDSFKRVLKVATSDGSTLIEKTYDSADASAKVVRIALSDGSFYRIDYNLNPKTQAGTVDVIGPNGDVRRVTIDSYRPGESLYTASELKKKARQR
jgi:hypothetical protein